MHLIAHATAQQQGGRTHQCDATVTAAAPGGIVAFAVLDGIGSAPEVRAWTRRAAGRVARAALRARNAEDGIRQVYEAYAASGPEFTEDGEQIGACAVVALVVPGEPLQLAWCGDVRAYAVRDDQAEPLSRDHNQRRVLLDRGETPEPDDRNLITSCLGADETDDEVQVSHGHPLIESAVVESEELRLILATDGAYEPHEDFGHHLPAHLPGIPAEAAKEFARAAVECSRSVNPPTRVDNATVTVVDLVP
jgi:serine/threonine protein phosphatase PrpC